MAKEGKAKKYKIITDFGDSEVRAKSKDNLPKYFREWSSVSLIPPLRQKKWNQSIRRVNVLGYPPLDIYSEWLMDFASISACQLDRTDWENFRRSILIHLPKCPLYCWYCFNDAWPTKKEAKAEDDIQCDKIVRAEEITVSKLLVEFKKLHNESHDFEGRQYNLLRISGGEPFTEPEFIEELARGFGEIFEKTEAFLWVDTNLIPFTKGIKPEHEKAIDAIKSLGNQAAIHCCLHGGDNESYEQNTLAKVDIKGIYKAIEGIFKKNVNLYPRINPIGLTPSLAKDIFKSLSKIDESLPAKTYLGPVEIHYDAAIDRMLLFHGKNPKCNPRTKPSPKVNTNPPAYHPPNAVIYEWNRLMKRAYGFGYAVVPRHLDVKFIDKNWIEKVDVTGCKQKWEEIFIVTKGWRKEVYARKLLELLALPTGAKIEIEYENRWVDPTLLAHIYAAPDYYQDRKFNILFVASFQDEYRLPPVMPLRWGTLRKVRTEHLSEDQSVLFEATVDEYAVNFEKCIGASKELDVAEKLAEYIGLNNLPYPNPIGNFCQLIGVELKQDIKNGQPQGSFKATVVNVSNKTRNKNYAKSLKDIYYRIKSISCANPTAGKDKEVPLSDSGDLELHENDEIAIEIESCNPHFGDIGYPDVHEAQLQILSSPPDKIQISPERIALSKYGSNTIRIKFPREGYFEGEIIVRPESTEIRLAEISIPFKVNVEKNDE